MISILEHVALNCSFLKSVNFQDSFSDFRSLDFQLNFFILLGTELLGSGPKSKARGRARLRLEQVRLAKHLDRVSSHQIKLRDSCPRSDRATTPRSRNYNESTKFIDQERQ